MNKMQLKNTILQKLSQINDSESLEKILNLINQIHYDSMDKKEKYPFLGNNPEDSEIDKENFNEYIKEWIKQM